MPRITKVSSKEELKNIFVETLLNNTSNVTKVSNHSVLSGTAYGIATISQKTLAEVAAVESYLFPNTASDSQLDGIASNSGIAPRLTSLGSSTYIRIVADLGTTYTVGVHTFTGNHGIVFNLDSDVIIGSIGFAYAKVSSFTSGADTNVAALTINTVLPVPDGHVRVTNEYMAEGGRDNESADIFRKRIKEGANILARGTLSALEQVLIKTNNNILKIFNHGITSVGNIKLSIATQNGVDLTTNEFNALLEAASSFVSMTEMRPYGRGTYGIEFSNIEYEPIDISFRVNLESGYDPDTYRIDVQTKMSKYLDFRFFNPDTDFVEWDNLLEIGKNTKGAKYVPDQYFFVNTGRTDIKVSKEKLPRIRSFAIYDNDGVIIQDVSGTLSPVFFPNQTDLNFQLTVLKTIS